MQSNLDLQRYFILSQGKSSIMLKTAADTMYGKLKFFS